MIIRQPRPRDPYLSTPSPLQSSHLPARPLSRCDDGTFSIHAAASSSADLRCAIDACPQRGPVDRVTHRGFDHLRSTHAHTNERIRERRWSRPRASLKNTLQKMALNRDLLSPSTSIKERRNALTA